MLVLDLIDRRTMWRDYWIEWMVAVVLIAIMVDRRAITFRTLAVAAMIVHAIAPESLIHPSFQMSFAATLGLVARVLERSSW